MTPEILTPGTVDELAAALRDGAAAAKRVAPVGGGCFLDLGGIRKAPDLVLKTGGLARTIFYEPEELVVKVEAGMTLAALQAMLAAKGQEIPWDLPWPDRQTVGGILATGLAGPRRLGFGMPRDHVLGVTVALPDGRLMRPGGRVVKNVAGYDLTRLVTGSRGALGVIVEAALKVKPLPEDALAVTAGYASPADLGAVLEKVYAARVTPSFLEIRGGWGAYTLAAGLEGLREAVDAQRERLLEALRSGKNVNERRGPVVRPFLADQARAPWETPGVVIRASVPRSRITTVLEAVEGPVVVNAGNGVVRHAPGRAFAPAEARDLLARVASIATGLGGWAVLERGPLTVDQAEPSLAGRTRELDAALRRVFDQAGVMA